MKIILSITLVLAFIILFISRTYTIWSGSGLSNRLRTILAHLYTNKKINVYWPIDKACNGSFIESFEPLENVNFIPIYKSIPMHFIGQNSFDKIIKKKIGNIDETDLRGIEIKMYSMLKLRKDVREKALNCCH